MHLFCLFDRVRSIRKTPYRQIMDSVVSVCSILANLFVVGVSPVCLWGTLWGFPKIESRRGHLSESDIISLDSRQQPAQLLESAHQEPCLIVAQGL